jgi:hypothetical protein
MCILLLESVVIDILEITLVAEVRIEVVVQDDDDVHEDEQVECWSEEPIEPLVK